MKTRLKRLSASCVQAQWPFRVTQRTDGAVSDRSLHHRFHPFAQLLPGYMNSEVRSQIVGNALRWTLCNRYSTAEPLYYEHSGHF